MTRGSPTISGSSFSIPERLYFRIGDVADIVGVKPYVLRYWETEFSSISPQKSASGQRVYRRSDVEMVLLIRHLLYEERYSIDGARRKLKELRKDGALRSYLAERASIELEPRTELESRRTETELTPSSGPALAYEPNDADRDPPVRTPSPMAASEDNLSGEGDHPLRFLEMTEVLSEARELATLAAERALGQLESSAFEEPVSKLPPGTGATAAGAPIPFEDAARAYSAFDEAGALANAAPATHRERALTQLLEAAGDLKAMSESPISDLYA